MSYSRWHMFDINNEPVALPIMADENQSNDIQVLKTEGIDSRSDYFGRIIETLIDNFDDTFSIDFLAYGNGDNGSNAEEIAKTTKIFDKEQQKAIIEGIDSIFSLLEKMDGEALAELFEDEIDVQQCLGDAKKIVATYQVFDANQEFDYDEYYWTGSNNDHPDSFFQSMLLIQKIFEYALERNLFVIYTTCTE